ncbi:MAG TPA: DNA alkylation repair protein [Bacteroidia bacterium]|nr:DNA alkylation repair protein [Bacteroidia bacterium]
MHPYVKGLRESLKKKENTNKASSMKAYMRDQFEFYGIQAPERHQLFRLYFNNNALPSPEELSEIETQLWALPQRDFQYFGVTLAMKFKRKWNQDSIQLFEWMALHKSWWDSVDLISNKLIGPWFLKYPEQIVPITSAWNQSENIWLNRMSLIFQLTYRAHTDKKLLEKYIMNLSNSDEFFIRKAIGWSLRQYSKYNPEWVVSFVQNNKLKPLSVREALKIIDKK